MSGDGVTKPNEAKCARPTVERRPIQVDGLVEQWACVSCGSFFLRDSALDREPDVAFGWQVECEDAVEELRKAFPDEEMPVSAKHAAQKAAAEIGRLRAIVKAYQLLD